MTTRDPGKRPFSTSTPRSSQETARAEAQADRHARRATVLAMVCAATMIAHQVGGKAARDAGFLSVFDVTLLPWMVIASAVLSLVGVVFFSRILGTWGPSRVVPPAFLLSAVAQVAEFFVAEADTRLGVVLFYLHMAIFNVILISAFWSLLNEVFDPRRGKQSFGKIAAAGALGGVFGGLLAAWAGGALGTSILLVLGGLHLACGLVVFAVRPERNAEPPTHTAGRARGPGAVEILRESSYLRSVAVLVTLLTAGATLLDYVFKSEAAGAHADHAGLTRYFALFYTAVAVLGFLLQAAAGKRLLERLGLVRTAATLPVLAGLGSVIALILPGLGSASLARGLESSTRISFFRSGYEGLFTPVAVGAKRSVKTLIDVGADRLGDVLGAGAVALFLFLLDGAGVRGFVLGAVLVYAAAIWLLPRLQRGYVKELEMRMRRGSGGQEEVDDASASLLRTMTGLDLSMILDTSLEAPPVSTGDTPELPSAGGAKLSPEETLRRQVGRAFEEPALEDHKAREPLLADIAAARSREPLRIRRLLARQHAPSPEIVPHLIPLLAWNEVAADVMRALRHGAPRVTGQILDHLLDPDEDFTVRRRLPRVLSLCPTDRAVEGLLRGLHDPRFEVRYQCGLTLSRLHTLDQSLTFDRNTVQTAVLTAVRVGKRVWSGTRLIDSLAPEDESMFMDDAVRNRANRSLEHVFNLLSLILPPDPLKTAFRGLHTTDPGLRATSLEYLENVLPREIQEALVPVLDIRPVHAKETRPRDEIVASLLQSSASIQINLEELRKAYAEQKKSDTPDEDA